MASTDKTVSFYINGKLIGESHGVDINKEPEPVDFKWEYYYKRSNKYYFRSPQGKIIIEFTGELKELVRGQKYELNGSI